MEKGRIDNVVCVVGSDSYAEFIDDSDHRVIKKVKLACSSNWDVRHVGKGVVAISNYAHPYDVTLVDFPTGKIRGQMKGHQSMLLLPTRVSGFTSVRSCRSTGDVLQSCPVGHASASSESRSEGFVDLLTPSSVRCVPFSQFHIISHFVSCRIALFLVVVTSSRSILWHLLQDESFILWNVATGKQRIRIRWEIGLTCIGHIPDRNYVVVGHNSHGRVSVADLVKKEMVFSVSPPDSGCIWSLVVCPEFSAVVTANANRSVILWDYRDPSVVGLKGPIHTSKTRSYADNVKFLPDHSQVIVLGGQGGIHLFDLRMAMREVAWKKVVQEASGNAFGLTRIRNEDRFVATCQDGEIVTFDINLKVTQSSRSRGSIWAVGHLGEMVEDLDEDLRAEEQDERLSFLLGDQLDGMQNFTALVGAQSTPLTIFKCMTISK